MNEKRNIIQGLQVHKIILGVWSMESIEEKKNKFTHKFLRKEIQQIVAKETREMKNGFFFS